MRVTSITVKLEEGQLLDSSAIYELIDRMKMTLDPESVKIDERTLTLEGTAKVHSKPIDDDVKARLIADHTGISAVDLHLSKFALHRDSWTDEWVLQGWEAD